MTGKIFKKEFSDLITSARFGWCTLIFLLLLLIGLLNGVNYFSVETERRDAAALATYEQWLNQGEKNPHSAAHYGFYAYKPVSNLSILDKGLDDYLGSSIWLEAHNQNETKSRSITDKISLSRFGDITAGLLITIIIPLLMVILGYSIISAEKENGTLRMLLSTSVSSRQVLWGKAGALFAVSAIWLLIAILASAIIVFAAGKADQGRTGMHLLLITLLLLLLQGAIALGITALSAQCRQSSTSLVAGIAIWVVMAILIPRLNGTIAEMISPTPSAFAFQQAVEFDKENGLDGHNPASERGKKFQQEILKKYGVDSLSQLPVNFAGLSLQAGEEEGNKIFDKHFSRLQATLRSQDKTMYTLSVFSPVVAARNLVFGFSETDLGRHTLYINQAEHHRRTIQKLLNDDYAMGGAGKSVYLRTKELWAKTGNFTLKNEATSSIFSAQLLNIGVIMAWLLLALCFFTYSGKQLKPFS